MLSACTHHGHQCQAWQSVDDYDDHCFLVERPVISNVVREGHLETKVDKLHIDALNRATVEKHEVKHTIRAPKPRVQNAENVGRYESPRWGAQHFKVNAVVSKPAPPVAGT